MSLYCYYYKMANNEILIGAKTCTYRFISDHSVLNKNYEKARTESSKNREKKNDQKNRNGKILRTFGPYIF